MTARVSRWAVGVLCGVLLFVTAAPSLAADPVAQPQTPAPAATPPAPEAPPGTSPEADAAIATQPAAPDYVFPIPDLKPGLGTYDGSWFWFQPHLAILEDYTWFEQDDASLAQVGKQEDTFEQRAFRPTLTFRGKGESKWEFFVAADFQEKRTREKTVFDLYDLRFTIPLGPVKISVGKMKPPNAYEVVGLSAQLPQQERILRVFVDSRNDGVQLQGLLAGDRMTWAAGVFNDWLETGASRPQDNATDYVARVTGLAWVSPDNMNFLHLGLDLQRRGSDNGMMRFKARPETNVGSYYIDTGDFPADHANEVGLEAVWQRKGVTLMGEYFDARVDAPQSGNPHFSAGYATASWVLSGEGRPYVRALGAAGGILPKGRFGAVELVAKFSYISATDGPIDGGVLNKWHFGVNWWASAQWKVGVSYGNANLGKDGLAGNTKMVLMRLQWLY